jgi:hypothetical protein
MSNDTDNPQNKLFLWNSVMCGGYTGGVAFAVAATKEEARKLLLAELDKDLKEGNTGHLGTWLNEIDTDPEKTLKVQAVIAKFDGLSPSDPRSKPTFDALSDEEKHIFRVAYGVIEEKREDRDCPTVKARIHSAILAQFAKELDLVEPTEQELGPFCYFHGGGD